MNIGMLTGGGDCPGLNAVIRAVVKRGVQLGHEFTGVKKRAGEASLKRRQ